MRKLISLILSGVILVFGLASCKNKNSADGSERVITVYRYTSLGLDERTEDAAVERAIADKFYKDTGFKIRLDVKLFTHSELKSKVDTNWAKKTADMDGVLHYVSEDHGCATLSYATMKNTVFEVKDLLDRYGPNIKKYMFLNDENKVRRMSCYVKCGDGFKMNYLIGVQKAGQYGLLVRKDYMKAVRDSTGIDPEEYDVTNENYKNMSFSDFEKVLYAIREKYSSSEVKYPIVGAPWDMDKTLANTFGMSGYSTQKGEDGRYGRPQFAPHTGEWLDTIQKWAHDGIWEPESTGVTDAQRRGWFVAGQAAVFAGDPTAVNLIATRRLLQAYDKNAEYMLIAPLSDENGVVRGYTDTYSPDGLIIPSKSDDAEMLIRYIDWLYSDVENYELAAYGVKGVHWTEGEDRTVGDACYRTWVYPDGKEDEYSLNVPYQGRYNILGNVYVSDRIRGDYNTEEMKWYHCIANEFPVFHSNDLEGIHIGNPPSEYRAGYNYVDGPYVESVRSYAWAGIYYKNPDTGKPEKASETLRSYLAATKATPSCVEYLNWLNDLVEDATEFKKTL